MGLILLLILFFQPSFASAENLSSSEANKIINQSNWEENSGLLLEPIAKMLREGQLEIVVQEKADTENSGEMLSESMGLYNFTRVNLSHKEILKNQGSFALSYALKDPSNPSLKNREVTLHLLSPAALKDWIYSVELGGFDPKGEKLDAFRVHTSYNKCRNIYYENLSDELLSSSVAFKDFAHDFVSDNQFSVQEVERKPLFLPAFIKEAEFDFPPGHIADASRDAFIKSALEASCEIKLEQPLSRKSTPLKKIIYSTAQARVGAVKRDASIFQLRPVSPFSEIGFELLIVDTNNKLPAIRLVYDTKIKFLRAILYYWEEVTQADKPVVILNGILTMNSEASSFFESHLLEAYLNYNKNCLEEKFKSLCSKE